jgi:hypothetical protein
VWTWIRTPSQSNTDSSCAVIHRTTSPRLLAYVAALGAINVVTLRSRCPKALESMLGRHNAN